MLLSEYVEALPGGAPGRLSEFKMSLVGTFLLFYPRFASPWEIYLTLLLFVAISSECCRYFLAHVACRNLPWQGLYVGKKGNGGSIFFGGGGKGMQC